MLMNCDSLGERIRSARLSSGLTQQALAQKLGITQQGILRLEKGIRQPSFALACKLADALGISLDQLRKD